MSAKIDDGGPAFPDDRYQVGMSLRDWFAGQALSGWLASFGPNAQHPASNTENSEEDRLKHLMLIAQGSYSLADAMLRVVRKSKEEVS